MMQLTLFLNVWFMRHIATTTILSTPTLITALSLSSTPDSADYRRILLSGAPMMDVRSPIEYAKGSVPSASNLPLLTDDERHLVGCAYKQRGEAAAVELGHSLVNGETKAARLREWVDFCRSHPNAADGGAGGDGGYLFCFRGGLRSQTVQRWIEEETGVRYPLVTGGYKAMRTFLMGEMERWAEDTGDSSSSSLVVVCGRTGSGKTRIIEGTQGCGSVDLEGLARHRGSAFGALPGGDGQPGQVEFENSVIVALLRAMDLGDDKVEGGRRRGRVLVEDEGPRIGNVGLPHPLRVRMQACDGIVMVEQTVEERVDVLVEDYVTDLRRRFVERHGGSYELGLESHREFCLGALGRVRKRLGGVLYEKIKDTMEAAFRGDQIVGAGGEGDMTLHRVWITSILVNYYDKMYDYQLAQRTEKILFKGDRNAVTEWARSTYTSKT